MKNAWRLIEAATRMAKRLDSEQSTRQFGNWIDEIQVYPFPAGDPSGNPIVAGNWNSLDRYDSATKSRVALSGGYLPRRLEKALERAGYNIEWSDQCAACEDCGGCIETEPTHHGWTLQAWFDESAGGYVCADCVRKDPSDYLGSLEGNPRAGLTIRGIDLASHGYIKLATDLANGFHEGQADDPKVVARILECKGIKRFIFEIEDVGQFDLHFGVWVHGDEFDANALEGEDTTVSPSPAERARAILSGAAR